MTDYGWNNYWSTSDEPNSWICFDFKENRVCLMQYSLESGCGNGLLQWVMEGSDDGRSWCGLDSRHTRDLSVSGGTWATKTCDCQHTMSESFRYLRLRQTGTESSGHHYLLLKGVELFGTIHRRAN